MALPGMARGGQDAAQLLDLAGRAYGAGDLRRAEQLCLAALRERPGHPETMHLLALVRHRTGRSESAAGLLEKAVAAAPESAEMHSHLGKIRQALNEPEAALARFERALALRPEDPEALFNRGGLFMATGRPEDAAADFEAALERAPDYAPALVNLGLVRKRQGRTDEAVAVYRRAAALHPDDATIPNNLGNALSAAGRHEEAVAAYRDAIARAPDYAHAHSNLGEALKALGAHAEAIDSFRRAGTSYARAKVPECQLAQGDWAAFDATVAAESAPGNKVNIRLAAFTAYAADRRGAPDAYPFCPDPLAHVRIAELGAAGGAGEAPPQGLLDAVIAEMESRTAVWELTHRTTKKGYQTDGNLFATPDEPLAALQRLIAAEIAAYREQFAGTGDGRPRALFDHWPENSALSGWFVRLKRGGHQDGHIHPQGWVSGVVYLDVPEDLPGDEGAIEFGLKGAGYPDLGGEASAVRHRPRRGEIAIFPSSLHHRTLPFDSERDRLSLAFDLVPAALVEL